MRFLRRYLFSRNFVILALLITAVGSITIGLTEAPRVNSAAPWLFRAAIISLLAGWLLATARIPGPASLTIGATLGMVWAIVAGGRLDQPLLNWLSKLPPLLPQIVRSWRWPETSPDWHPFIIAGQLLASDTRAVCQRLAAWGMGIWQGQLVSDAMPLAIFWLLVVWLLAFWAGWATRHLHNPLLALAPAIGLLAAVLNYQGLDAHTLIVPLAVAMLLMALMRYNSREHRWVQQHIDFAEDIPLDLMTVAGLLVAGLLIVGFFTPTFSLQALADFTRQFSRSSQGESVPMGEALGLEAKPPPASAHKVRPAGLSISHNLSGRPNLTSDMVMVIEVSQPRYTVLPPYQLPVNEIPAAPRYYWRMLTYDHYTGYGWRSSQVNSASYAAGTALFNETPAYHQVIRQRITPIQGLGGVLYATGQLQSASLTYEVEWRTISGQFIQADLFGTRIADSEYQVTSYLPDVAAAQLRATPVIYPAEISHRYLQLTENLPIRVRELALKLTTNQPTPYDKASAIEQFLRTLPYSLDISAPPRGRDSVDYFLFDLQTGFCDYYASAMTVLARSAGLPARVVMGYASGSFDGTSGRYVVRETDAHSWVEIYFPEIGWVEFEPTAAQPAIIRPDDANHLVLLPGVELPQPHLQPATSLAARLKGYAGLALLSLACLGALAVQGAFAARSVEMWWWSRQPPKQAVIAIYERMRHNGERLLGPLPGGDTPDEFTNRLVIRLENIAQLPRNRGFCRLIGSFLKRQPAKTSTTSGPHAWLMRRMVAASAEIQYLTELYTQAVYSEHPITNEMQRAALQTWRSLRKCLWLAGVVERLRRHPKSTSSQ